MFAYQYLGSEATVCSRSAAGSCDSGSLDVLSNHGRQVRGGGSGSVEGGPATAFRVVERHQGGVTAGTERKVVFETSAPVTATTFTLC